MARVKKDKRSDALNSKSPLSGQNVRMPLEWKEKLLSMSLAQKAQGKIVTISDLIRSAIWRFCFEDTK